MNSVCTMKHNGANVRSGAVLLVVLFVSMVVALLSMTVLVRANRQVLVAGGSAAKLELDYLAEAGLVHAKALLLHPHDVAAGADGYWQGGEGLQIEAGDCYYDLTVTRPDVDDRCTYRITSRSYRSGSGVQSNLEADLRLDPCIALRTGADASLPGSVTIRGDVYCGGVLSGSATLYGDVFGNADAFTGLRTGREYAATDLNLTLPDVNADHFSGSIFEEDLTIDPNNIYDRPICVVGNLTITDGAIINISADKNYPALVVTGELSIESGAQLDARGLVKAGSMRVEASAGRVSVLGALFVDGGMVVDGSYVGPITITADPMSAAVKTSNSWSPAAGGFFKYVKRVEAAPSE